MLNNDKVYKLPIEAYTSREWFKREQDEVFSKVWQFAGFIEELKSYGDHICVDIGGHHIVVVMGEEGSLRAFHSTCLHRGNRAEVIIGNEKKSIRCPYHNWTYSFDGKLIGIPEKSHIEFEEGVSYALKPASVSLWKTMIFVHPEGEAPSFEQWIKPLEDHMGPHRVELLEEYRTEKNTYLVKCNWKVFVENYMDGYHLPYLHSNTLNMYDHAKQRSCYTKEHWTFYEPLTQEYLENLNKYKYSYLPVIDHIDRKNLGAYVHMIFPNIGVIESESAWTVLKVVPLKENETYLEYRTKVMPKAAKYSNKKNKDKNRKGSPIKVEDYDSPLDSGDFMIEDMYICENIQNSMEKGSFQGGPMHGEKEASLSSFQDMILKYMK